MTTFFGPRNRVRSLGLVGLLGCGGGDGNPGPPYASDPSVSSDGGENETEGDSTDGSAVDSGGAPPIDPVDPPGPVDAVDVLFVIDNSFSMASFQGQLARNLVAMVAALDETGVDWRIGFTTTDHGGPGCDDLNTTPEYGALVARSCLDFEDQFANPTVGWDLHDVACASHCKLRDEDLGLTEPWLERIGGVTNTSVSAGQAVTCMAPMGVDGCGWERPLDSISRALDRFVDPEDPSYGFMRDEASLAIVLLTDEADCSARDASIFDEEGLGTFWGGGSGNVCWHAGTVCEVDPLSLQLTCAPGQYDVGGASVAWNDPSAVLVPIQEFAEELAEVAAVKRSFQRNAGVFLAVIAGYSGGGTVEYLAGAHPDQPVLPGCTAVSPLSPCTEDGDCPAGTCVDGSCLVDHAAQPPVRVEVLQRAFPPYAGASICADEYEAVLVDWAALFVDGL